MQLFRPEAMHVHDRLAGEVVLAPPVSWQVLGSFLGATVLIAFVFLFLAEYSQTTTVNGRIDGDRGIVRLMPFRPGVISTLLVVEGSHVRPGQIVAQIRYATSDGDKTLEERRAAAIGTQGKALAGQLDDLQAEADAKIAGLLSATTGEREQIASLRDQIQEQLHLIDTSAADVARMEEVARNGFISKHEIQEREEALTVKRQALSQLYADQATHRSAIEENLQKIAQTRADLRVQLENLERTRAEVAGDAAQDVNIGAGAVTAPIDGIITGIEVHPGEIASSEMPVASLVPTGTRLVARVEIPAGAVGLVQAGQPMRLAIDAYPYQTYGTVKATLESVTRATSADRNDAAFIGYARIQERTISAYGRPQVLWPGMTLTARIATRRRSLVQWLFDPLYAISRR